MFGKTVSSVVAIVTLAYLLFGAIKGKEYFQVKQVVFSSPDLPESFDGYRILQLSDIHAGSWKGNAEALRWAVEICNAQHPDLVVFTGDLVNSRADEIKEFMPVLSKLRARMGYFLYWETTIMLRMCSGIVKQTVLLILIRFWQDRNRWAGRCL